MSKVIHFEIVADNPKRAADFYSAVFGWKIEKMGKMDYWMINSGPKSESGINGAIMPRAGIFKKKGGFNAYVCTVEVERLRETINKVLEAGGKQVNEGGLIHGVGFHMYFEDTEGNIFGALQPDTKAKNVPE